VTSVSGTGTIKINLDKNLANIIDSLGIPAQQAFHGWSDIQHRPDSSDGQPDRPAGANPTSATTVAFAVVFSKSVTGVAQATSRSSAAE